MGLFGRKKQEDRSVEALLAESNAASPTGAAVAPAATPVSTGDGSFRMPVEDVFFITGRGVVVTGRVEAGLATVGQQVNVVRDGAVAFTTTITGIEMFRKVVDTATAGDNVGLLLRDLRREQLHTGDLVQG
jgi:elongation factor Tu